MRPPVILPTPKKAGEKSVGELALTNGAAELIVSAHGAVFDGRYQISGGLDPAQLAALIAGHPQLAIEPILARGGMPAIRHLQLRACGIRCKANYEPGDAPGQAQDEVAFAQELVRRLGDHGVAVRRVTSKNAEIMMNTSRPGEHGAWFRLRDALGNPSGVAYESQLLVTSQDYDAANDRFVDGGEFDVHGRVAIESTSALPPATHADTPRAPDPDGVVADWIEDGTGGAIASPGHALRTSSGAVVDVSLAPGVTPRLEASMKVGADWRALNEVDGKPGTVVTAADLSAIAAGTRHEAGRILVVDTDPARMDGVRLAVNLAGSSADMADWIAKLRAHQLDTAGTALVTMWENVASQAWSDENGTFHDPQVVRRLRQIEGARACRRLHVPGRRPHHARWRLGGQRASRAGTRCPALVAG